MNHKMTLEIASIKFDVTLASVTADVRGENISWAINIETRSRRVNQELWSPRLYSEQLLPIDGLKLKNWDDAFHQVIHWASCYDDERGMHNASLYVAEHNDVYESTLKVHSLSANEIGITWIARCDVYFDGFGENLALQVRTTGMFDGVIVGNLGENISEKEAELKLRKHIFEGDYVFHPSRSSAEYPMMRLKPEC